MTTKHILERLTREDVSYELWSDTEWTVTVKVDFWSSLRARCCRFPYWSVGPTADGKVFLNIDKTRR